MSDKLVKALHETCTMDAVTLREFDALCLPPVKTYSAAQIRRLRQRSKASQAAEHEHVDGAEVGSGSQAGNLHFRPGLILVQGQLPGSAGVSIAARPSAVELATLTEKHGVEFTVTYKYGTGMNGGGGQYYLFSGTSGAVKVPVTADQMLIYHTHPGGTPFASQADMDLLGFLKAAGSSQRSSQIVPVGKNVVRFGPNGRGY